MKLQILLRSGFLMAIAALLALAPALPAAAQDGDQSECSLSTLQGAYGALVEGTVVLNPIPYALAPPYHFVISGLVTFDGKGNISTKSRQSFGGGIFPVALGTGTYSVNPDCTYSVDLPHFGSVSHRVGIIIGAGINKQELQMMYADAWWIAAGALKKVPVNSCSLATLGGTYALLGNGTMPPMSAPLLVTQAGILTFDGAGNVSGRDMANIMGAVVPDAPVTGTYAVSPDCTASATVHTSLGDIQAEGVITGEGQFKEFRGIFTNAGWAFAQTLKKQ